MHARSAVALTASLIMLGAAPALAADLPAIKAGNGNSVPECVTPGRLMAMTKARNGSLDARFASIAAEYMRHGEALEVRWDYAYFQMLLETGNLAFKRGNGRDGDVKLAQNNFAGLGATGKGEPGESFKNVSTGVRAHLEHVLLYSGDPVANPVAERTRKVQEWGILTSWQKGLKGRVTFSDLARKWAPGDRSYSGNIASVAERFFDDHCKKPDPHPEMAHEVRGISVASKKNVGSKGAEIARRAVEETRTDASETTRKGLGAAAAAAPAAAPSTTGLTVVNQPKPDAKPETPAPVQTAAAPAGTLAAQLKPQPPTAATAKCKVWTASYGGQKAIIIKALGSGTTNYTVLDVNEGVEKREADAYIAAYAKGGQTVGEFGSTNAALDKAFELCPEG